MPASKTEQENYVKAILKQYDTSGSGRLLLFSTPAWRPREGSGCTRPLMKRSVCVVCSLQAA